MEFKKCERCGCFFMSEDRVCCNCAAKDRADGIKILSYLEEHNAPSSLEELSAGTGISIRNLSRFNDIHGIDNIKGISDFNTNIGIEL